MRPTNCRTDRRGPVARFRAILGLALGLGLLSSHRAADGQEQFHFDVTLESQRVPDLDESSTVEGSPGDRISFTATLSLASSGLHEPAGPEFWALALWHSGVDVVEFTTEGTAAARQRDGGFLDDDELASFVLFERIPPNRNGGRQGIIQIVELSDRDIVSLPTNSRQPVAKLRCVATVGSSGSSAFLRFENGLLGRGQPVVNQVLLEGRTVDATGGHRTLTIGDGGEPESGNCDDGVDNDRNGFSDCEDPACFTELPCGAESCDDGVDNDENGLVDCDDPACARDFSCREICDDGIDNDRDGAVDCLDAECTGRTACPTPEDCTDGIDNDLDGDTDCEDLACERHPLCRELEDCNDGVDNDLDGRIDCDDSDCAGIGNCLLVEDCDDGIDNDGDGDVDCDDDGCWAVSACRSYPEICNDGIDNDLDGRADCEDPECASRSGCPPAEICNNDRDDDGDGRVDCDDPSCREARSCGVEQAGFDIQLFTEGAHRQPGSGGEPDRNVVELRPGREHRLEVATFLVPVPSWRGGPESGTQGYSLSIVHDDEILELVEFPSDSLQGTDARNVAISGFLLTQASRRVSFPPVEPGLDDEHPGVVEEGDVGYLTAVILSHSMPVTLDPTRPQSMSIARYRVRDNLGEPGFERATIRFLDGLQGTGQPYPNVLTIRGETHRPLRYIDLEIRAGEPAPSFVRGDANSDGRVDLADAIWTINELVRGGPRTTCEAAADTNSDDRVDLSDAVYLAQYRFRSGATPPAPFPDCGPDEEGSSLDCASSACD